MVVVSVGERPWPVGRVQERHFLGRGQHPRSASHHRRAGGGSCLRWRPRAGHFSDALLQARQGVLRGSYRTSSATVQYSSK